MGKDFDFFGQTAEVSNAIAEEQVRFSRQQIASKPIVNKASSPPKSVAKLPRSGYEKYREPSQISDLQVDPNLWGGSAGLASGSNRGLGQHSASQTTSHPSLTAATAPTRKMLSLEEVEAQLHSQKPAPGQATPSHQTRLDSSLGISPQTQQFQQRPPTERSRYPQPQPAIRQQTNTPPQGRRDYNLYQGHIPQVELPTSTAEIPQALQRPPSSHQLPRDEDGAQHPRQILQNPRRHQAQGSIPTSSFSDNLSQPRMPPIGPAGFQHQAQMITHPQHLVHLSEEERAIVLAEDAMRARRNYKIRLLSKDNGLMTPQDKNFITRIQLQQLMAATGNTNEQEHDAALSEDFYYQVHSQIRGGPRQNPQQPLSHFAQTYLFQTGGRIGGNNRRQNRGGDNHMQRMEQQVQRAVEAAKLKPKNKQLVIEGSLGKISFSNAKTPKPLLNIKRAESGDVNRPGTGRNPGGRRTLPTEMSASDRKSVLRNIEAVYSVLMKIEDNMRREPLPPTEESDAAAVQRHAAWRSGIQTLNEGLWHELRVLEPINSASSAPHPFIAFISYGKGKKAIPRVFRHLSDEQRVMMLTMIVLHLDVLDVVRLGRLQPGETQLPTVAREAIDLFSVAVTPSLFSYVSDAPLYHVIGFLGLILDRANVPIIAQTRVGLGILTMLTSRATLVKEAGSTDDGEWQQWSQIYNRLFDILEPHLGGIFPGSINSGEDIYVWQFLAAIGSGASLEQQQRLVLAVK